MSRGLRVLTDPAEALDFLAQSPVENLFLAAKVAAYGLDRRVLGTLYAYEGLGRRVTSLLLDGGTVFVAGFDQEALPVFVDRLGPVRRCTSILGPAASALGIYLGLSQRWSAWGQVSNVRRHQPLMVLDEVPTPEPDPRVRLLTVDDYPSYLEASVHMYTEEIGSSPFKYGMGYERFVRQRLAEQDAFGIVEDGRVIFKADLGPKLGQQAQLQGVWVVPELRGSGLSVPALSGMLRLAMRRYQQISLYVNDFNTPAIRAYERLGFLAVGALATVHF